MWAARRFNYAAKLWSFKSANKSQIPVGLLTIATKIRWTLELQYSDYSFTKNIDGGLYGWPVTSELLTTFTDSKDGIEPRRLDEVILRIATWLNCSYDKAVQVLLSMPHLRSCHLEYMDGYVTFLERNGVSSELLRGNPWLLDDSVTSMRYKLHLVSRILRGAALNSNNVKLFRLERHALKRMGNKDYICFDDTVDFLAESLGESRAVIIELLDNGHRDILSMDHDRLVTRMTLLLESGVSPGDIKKDLWVFRNKESAFRTRLSIAREVGVKPIKPWIVRCSESRFQVFLQRTRIAQIIAGGDEQEHRIQYLSQRLGGRDVQDLVEDYPRVKSISVFKMKSSFDFLYKVGVTTEEIYNYPIILCANLKKLESRFKQLESCGLVERVPLNALYLPSDKFMRTLQRMATRRPTDVT